VSKKLYAGDTIKKLRAGTQVSGLFDKTR